MRPTLQTVAAAVGVSRSTVSNAYSRPDQLSPELRDRIFDAAERLGYAGPDPAARSLRRGRVGSIGVLFSATLSYAFTDPYAVRFLQGLAQTAEQYETGLLLMPLSKDGETTAAAVQNAVVDSFCVYCLPDWHKSLAAIKSRGLPIVSAERREEGVPDARYVGIDEAAATRVAGRHIVGFGHRRIAILADWIIPERANQIVTVAQPEDVPYYVARQRMIGYRDAFAEAGIAWPDVVTVNSAQNSRSSAAAAAALVLDRAPRVTAIVTVSDIQALGVLDALRERDLQPGRDVSVIGFDDIPDATAARLTTVRQPALDKGRIAGRLLLDPPDDPAQRQVVLPTELAVRASTGPAPA
jgi:DNA-binding LacI/PurR family transcriptional regulator